MLALQKAKPDIIVLGLFLYSTAHACAPAVTKRPQSSYALLPAFTDGMLEALGPQSMLVDGNEGSYYLDESQKYFADSDQADYRFVRAAAQALCAPELLPKWKRQGQVAMAPYVDLCYNLYQPAKWRTPEYESRWLRHNIYQSMLASDQYVWLYVEKIDFWTGKGSPAGMDLASDVKEAVTLYRNGKPPGYDMYKPAKTYQYHNDRPAEFVSTPAVTLTCRAAGRNQILLTATVDPAVAIERVEFFVNSLKVGEAPAVPYTVELPLPAGEGAAFARAFTMSGRHVTSTWQIITQPEKSTGSGSSKSESSAGENRPQQTRKPLLHHENNR